jgi:hypothetical protein
MGRKAKPPAGPPTAPSYYDANSPRNPYLGVTWFGGCGSWGRSWGREGFFLMHSAYIEEECWEAYAILPHQHSLGSRLLQMI